MSFGRIVGLVLLFLFFEIMVGASAKLIFETDPLIACAVMTALAGLIWLLYIATTRWLMRPRLPAPMPMPGQMPMNTPIAGMTPVAPGTDPESAEIANVMREADRTLAQSPRYAAQTHKPRVSELPLYVVFGGEQTGKTSVLYNSGVNATLLAGEAQRDLQIVPTRTLNLWFANDAVFADFSGRLAGEDNSRWMRALAALRRPPETKKAWQKLLDFRTPAQNLRGAVVCVDLSQFLGTPDPARITAAARQLNERLRSIGAVFGVSFPVYLLFTKTDKVPYFAEFFGRLSDDEERKVIGCTLPLPEGPAGAGDVYAEAENKRLGGALDRLISSLTNKRLGFLARESSLPAKPAIYEHPREWRRFRPELVRYLVEAFRPDVLAASPQLRGFYFAGVRQALANVSANPGQTIAFDPGKTAVVGGTQIFQVGMTQVFGGPTPPASMKPPAGARATISRWAFLGQLFNDIILADHAAVPAAPVDARQSLTQRIVFGGAAALGTLLCICLLGSWANNWSMVRDLLPVATLAEQRIPRGNPALDAGRLEALDGLKRKIELLRGHEKPLFYRFGLWSGDRALEALRSEYFGLFKGPFYTPMVEGLEKLFAYGNLSDVSNRIYSYRAMTSGGCKPNESILGGALPPVWQANAQSRPDADTAALAEKQIRFYARELEISNPYAARKEDLAAVEKARSSLKGTTESALMMLVGDINSKVPAAELIKYSPNYQGFLLAHVTKVEGAFTKQGWELFDQRMIKGDWNAGDSCVMGGVAGSFAADAGFKERLQELYAKRYIEVWKQFLMGSHVDMSGTDADKSRKLSQLGGNRSPMLGLLAMASDHTRSPGGAATAVTSAVGGVVDDARKFLQKAKGEGPPEKKANRDLVIQAFQPVHAVISVDDPQKQLVTDANAAYIGGLKAYGDALAQLGPNSDPASVQQVDQVRRQAAGQVTSLASKFTFVDSGVNEEVQRFLSEPLESRRVFDPYKSDKERINGAAGDACRKLAGLMGRFPFNPRSETDATLEQFNAVFAPSKIQPLQAALAPFAQADGRGGVIVSSRQLPIPQSVLNLYAKMVLISNTFYPPGSDSPRFSYSATISTASDVDRITLFVADKSMTAAPGKEDTKTFEWFGHPAPVRLTITLAPAEVNFGRFQGPWGIFRMMESADVKRPPIYEFNRMRRPGGVAEPQPDKKRQDTVTRLEIRPSGGVDVFAPGFLRLACPVEPVK